MSLTEIQLMYCHDFSALVESLSAAVLIVLFLLQRFGTSRVSFLFSPIMGAWTFSTPLVGIYRIIHHYPSIIKALSPYYIVHFFSRNGKEGWRLLGGIVLCITGEFLIQLLYSRQIEVWLCCSLLGTCHYTNHLFENTKAFSICNPSQQKRVLFAFNSHSCLFCVLNMLFRIFEPKTY